MKITEYADVLNANIAVHYYPNQANRWTACFQFVEVKEDKASAILKSEYGQGDSPDAAIADYVNLIRGKLLVFHAMSGEKRTEYIVPEHIEA